jgi:hypothetical protein
MSRSSNSREQGRCSSRRTIRSTRAHRPGWHRARRGHARPAGAVMTGAAADGFRAGGAASIAQGRSVLSREQSTPQGYARCSVSKNSRKIRFGSDGAAQGIETASIQCPDSSRRARQMPRSGRGRSRRCRATRALLSGFLRTLALRRPDGHARSGAQYVSRCRRPSRFSAAPTVSQSRPTCTATSRSASTTPSSIALRPQT